MTATPLTAVSGIGPVTAETLAASGFPDALSLADAEAVDLVEVPGFGNARAAAVSAAARALVGWTDGGPVAGKSKKSGKKSGKSKKSGKKSAKSKKSGKAKNR